MSHPMVQGQYHEHRQSAARPPSSQVLSEQYRLNIEAYQEMGRRRDRAHWCFLALNVLLIGGFVSLLVFNDSELLKRSISVLALLFGMPMCIAYRAFLYRCQQHAESNLGTIRKIEEHINGLDFSPIQDEDGEDGDPSKSAYSRCEAMIPIASLAVYLGLFLYVWAWDNAWLWNHARSLWERFSV